ncbi:PREDICTED: probable serine/threonine-protein kinase At1g54610 [Ipomoea nil]|uniref:probable serine/threonine-protein kinase At1g54610 n=1 Tax=Ipomoea nil TaxID=35883 RepID=UPI0009017AE5|nr:PREDICTED: probable serine/threonine-protein kinase At1g54610 [Ipomoea nil]XP_019166838.1 PREDICTED: probable serine/threonine-protein kinase At1g54610 [Ipomoea nil]XP_019166839.1 PREDICTED: probable serine/threonine-protein kinase At1g54610 [Ipomoea nil]
MGCAASKKAVSVTPAFDHSGLLRKDDGGDAGPRVRSGSKGMQVDAKRMKRRSRVGMSETPSLRLGNIQNYAEAEQVAAGWPAWLSAVAGEAIHGLVPLRADSFQTLEKIGQGTYSTVFQARDLDSGRIVALKKVRFDHLEPGSVQFMAREIAILRRLDHPNIIKLEGIVASQLSCSIYLVFEYMEHDVSGLLSCPEVTFNESQVKCYMKQLLSGLHYCHSRGIMHRDIKGANLLVNNEGILKVGDFGLANFCNLRRRKPLTSRVVTLWYRPPELLLGSTDYGASVDLWSVGCVFGELLTGRPILRGRTEVEQLHKIFKLCGSPPDEYWKSSKLPRATLFKPQNHYESCIREAFRNLPKDAASLIETLLRVEPHKRGTAASALASEYFKTKPFACDPSSMPKYPPNKEINARQREEITRKKTGARAHRPKTIRKLTRKQNGLSKHKPSIDMMEEASHKRNVSQSDVPFSGPLEVSGSSGFAWAKRRFDDSSRRSGSMSSSKSLLFEPSGVELKNNSGSKRQEKCEHRNCGETNSKCHDFYENAMHADPCDASDWYHPKELPIAVYLEEELARKKMNLVGDHGDRVEYSGPLLSQSHRVDELLEKRERQIRHAVQKSWL